MLKPTILLTGATGFVGSHLLKHLVKEKYEVVVLKRSTSDVSRVEKVIGKVTTYDIDNDKIETAFQNHKINVVMHLATSYGKKQNYENLIQTNIILGLDLVSLSIKYEVDVFMNTDTFFNSRNRIQSYLSDYTTTKKHFLDWLSLKKDSIKIVNMKLHHVYGEDDSHDKFSMWLLRELSVGNKDIKLTEGTQLRDFIYIHDVVKAYEVVMLENRNFESLEEFNISTGNKHTVKEFSNLMGQEILKNAQSVKEALVFGAKSDNLDELMDIDNDNKALLQLGWRPEFDLVNGIHNMIANTKGQ